MTKNSKVSEPPRFVRDATEPLTFFVGKKHHKIASCGDPKKCVIAQALRDKLGNFFEDVEVGASITKIFVPGQIIRYATASVLRKRLPHFDLHNQWDLPDGEYTILPPPASARIGARPNRFNRVSLSKGIPGRSIFKGRALPTRRVSRVRTGRLVLSPSE